MQKSIEKLPRVAFWLVPQQADRQKLEEHIASLAKEFSAPQFVPHVTLYSCFRTHQQLELAVLARLARQSKPIAMLSEGLSGKERMSRALFIDLQLGDSSFNLSRNLAEGVPEPSEYFFEPHLSLLYQDLSAITQKRLLKRLVIDFEQIRFDQLWAVAIPASLKGLEDFTGWQPLMICRLDSDKNAATL